MELEIARLIQRDRLAAAEKRRKRKAVIHRAKEQRLSGREKQPKVEWPVFSLRIGRYQLVAFRSVRLGS